MANPLKFGPVWVRNKGNTDMEKSNAPPYPPWDKKSKNFSENFYLTERDELQSSQTAESNGVSSIPSYSAVLRGSKSKVAQNEKSSENETKKSKEMGVLFERNYRQRNGGSRGTSIKLVDSSISSSTSNENSSLQNSDSLVTNSKEFSKTNGDNNCWRNTRNLIDKMEESSCEIAEKREENSREIAEKNSTHYNGREEENWRVKKDFQQTNNKYKSPKSVKWLDEVNSKRRNDESYRVARNIINEAYPARMSLKPNRKSEDNDVKSDGMDVRNETHSSHENQDVIFDENFAFNNSNLSQGCYMSKEDIDTKLTESIQNLLKSDESFHPEPTEPWPPTTSRQINFNPPAALQNENAASNSFLLGDSPISIAPKELPPPNNQPHYQHNSYYGEPPTLNLNPVMLQLPRMILPALNETAAAVNNPFMPSAIRPPVMMVDPASSHLWYYRDPHGRDQGPFSTTEMAEWYSYGYFDSNLQLKRFCDTRYVTLGELIRMSGNNLPFLASHLIPPLHNLPPSMSPGNPFS